MQQSSSLPISKPAPFVPRSVVQYREDPKPKSTRRQLPLRSTRERKELHDEVTYKLDNLLLLHDNYLAEGNPRPRPQAPVWTPLESLPGTPKRGRGRPSTQMVNGLKPFFMHLVHATDALDLPGLDDIISGAVALDLDGNTRPLNKKKITGLLQKLDVITANAVKEEMSCDIRHAQKVAACLRIIVMIGMRWCSSWPKPSSTDDLLNTEDAFAADSLPVTDDPTIIDGPLTELTPPI